MKNKRAINIIALIIGVGALSYLIYRVGFRELLDNLLTIGPVFPVLLVIEAISNALSCTGWYYSFDPASRPSYRKLLGISYASLSIAGALPTGQAGEVAKGNLLRGVSTTTEIVSSLLIYNYLHILTVMLLVFIGPFVALFTGGFDADVIWVTLGAGVLVLVVVLVLGAMLYSGVLHKLLEWVGRRRLIWKPSEKLLGGVRDVDNRLRLIIRERPGDIIKGSIGLLLGRVMGVIEVYVILSYMGVSDSVTVSLMIFSTTAMVKYLLMVLPAREGFLEGSTYVVFRLIGMNGADGLSLEITRRLRKIVFQVFGVGLMMYFVRKKDDNVEK